MDPGHFFGLTLADQLPDEVIQFELLCYNVSRDCNIPIVILGLFEKRLPSEGIRP